ncbi:MAG: metallophosphoesterase [Clostridia bacterium]|nr:metallophosphoesterase [Clostridia bacterium]
MRILAFSDSHHHINGCIKVINAIEKVDMILHAGDCNRDAEDLAALYPHIEIKYVQGNNDFDRKPKELCFEAGGKKIFLTHGHLYRVKTDFEYETLIEKAKHENADLAVFGHTHIPYSNTFGSLNLLNPGSICYCGTYGIIEIENGKLRTAVLSLR